MKKEVKYFCWQAAYTPQIPEPIQANKRRTTRYSALLPKFALILVHKKFYASNILFCFDNFFTINTKSGGFCQNHRTKNYLDLLWKNFVKSQQESVANQNRGRDRFCVQVQYQHALQHREAGKYVATTVSNVSTRHTAGR
jgi:hypothetical protein